MDEKRIEEHIQKIEDKSEANNNIVISKDDLQKLLANRDELLKKELAEERNQLQIEREKIRKEIQQELELKTRRMASVDDLDKLVAKVNGNTSSLNPNQMKIKEAEVIVSGEKIKRFECEIICAKRSPVTLLLTLDLVARKPEFAQQFANHFQNQAKVLGSDLDCDDELKKILINRGVRTKRILQYMSRAFLLQLFGVYGVESDVVTKVVAFQNKVLGKIR